MSAIDHPNITDFFVKAPVLKRASRNLQVEPEVAAMAGPDLALAYPEQILKYLVE
jgi:hypothetical protein